MAKRDYYEVLGVGKNATDAEIKKSYKRLAMKYHPDRNKDNLKESEKKFKEIREAYAILSDSQKRAAYDQFGHAGVKQGAGAGGFEGGGFGGFGDIFGDIFGSGGASAQYDNRGLDLRYNLEIDLKDAVEGTTVKIRIAKNEKCNTCNGSGAKPGTSPTTCSTCNGHGQVRMEQGIFSVQRTCPNCNGSGEFINNPCASCRGQGVVKKQKTLSVKIPPGVDTGNRIRLTGEGEAGIKGGDNGDLYVEVHVRKHNIFHREGNDLYCEVPISFVTASLGGSVEVPTLRNKLKVKIPAGTQTGRIFRLKGKGVPSVKRNINGDLLCQVKVETPVNLNSKQKQLLQEFGESCGEKHYPESGSFFSKMKSFFE